MSLTTRIPLDTPQTHELTTAGSVGLLLFEGLADQRVSIQLSDGTFGSSGLNISLYDPLGTKIKSVSGVG